MHHFPPQVSDIEFPIVVSIGPATGYDASWTELLYRVDDQLWYSVGREYHLEHLIYALLICRVSAVHRYATTVIF